MAQPAPKTVPETLEGRVVAGRYRLADVLGRGGFGAVYTGLDSTSGEAVAVKVFSRGEGLAPRADREARTARKLDHPNIHEVVGVAHDDDHAYLISQLVVGERFDRSGLTDEQAVRAIAAVCDALAHAHERGVVHRDVKPANILVSTDGTVHLTDFGIARDEDAREPTVDERLLGTLSYMAPEQASGQRATGATDVWSAGLTLYATLIGRNPYRARSLSELLDNLAERAAPLHRVRPELPAGALPRARARHASRPGRRPTAAGLRDVLLAAIAEPAVAAAPGWAPEAAPAASARRGPCRRGCASRAHAAAGGARDGVGGRWTLTAFPMYPPSWTLPIAAVLAALARRRPRRRGDSRAPCWPSPRSGTSRRPPASRGSRSRLPGRGRRRNDRRPRALPGAARPGRSPCRPRPGLRHRRSHGAHEGRGARPRRPRARWWRRSAAAGPARGLARALAGANTPLAYARAIGRDPALAATGSGAMVLFAVLLAPAWRAERRVQALSLWGLGFALAVAGIPQLLSHGSGGVAPAGSPRRSAAIMPAAWAVAGPDRKRGS